MKFRNLFVTLLAVLSLSFGAVAAQHDDHDATPDAGDHGDMDHGDPDHGDMGDISLAAFYFTVTNNGDEADTLLSIETDMANVVEVHDVEMKDGVMSMFPLEDGLEIPAGESVSLEPGGYHVMMIDITESLIDGGEFTATLTFENAGEVEITVPIFALEPEEGDFQDPTTVGDLEVGNIWARQAPKLDGGATPVASPGATPESTPTHSH